MAASVKDKLTTELFKMSKDQVEAFKPQKGAGNVTVVLIHLSQLKKEQQ